jgi:hypothetical protein
MCEMCVAASPASLSGDRRWVDFENKIVTFDDVDLDPNTPDNPTIAQQHQHQQKQKQKQKQNQHSWGSVGVWIPI